MSSNLLPLQQKTAQGFFISFHSVEFNAILIHTCLIFWAEHKYRSVHLEKAFLGSAPSPLYKYVISNQTGSSGRLGHSESFFVIEKLRIREYKPHPSTLVQREVSHSSCQGHGSAIGPETCRRECRCRAEESKAGGRQGDSLTVLATEVKFVGVVFLSLSTARILIQNL